MTDNVFEYELNELLEYSHKGNKLETACIIMRAPGMTEYNESEAFGQTLMQAITDAEDRVSDDAKEKAKAQKVSNDNEDVGKIKASELRAIVLASKRSPQIVAQRFKALAVKVSTLDDSGEKMKESHMDKMSLADFLNMMYGYAAHFIIPSLLNAEEQQEDKD